MQIYQFRRHDERYLIRLYVVSFFYKNYLPPYTLAGVDLMTHNSASEDEATGPCRQLLRGTCLKKEAEMKIRNTNLFLNKQRSCLSITAI
jgi:hypothetical protein